MQKFIQIFNGFTLTPTSKAQQITVGARLVCDHAEEIERCVALYHEGDSVETVVDEINHEANQLACGLLTLAFLLGEDIETIPINNGFGAIVKVSVVAVHTSTQWLRIPPTCGNAPE